MMHVFGVGVLPCIQDDSTPVSIFICAWSIGCCSKVQSVRVKC